jgi:hypothetical protein
MNLEINQVINQPYKYGFETQIEKEEFPIGMNEDHYFSAQTIIPLYRPSDKKALDFSFETIFHPTSFGTNNGWTHHDKKRIVETYPEIRELMELNGVKI